jgi:transcriptional regulator with XRE-family HTH domain
MANRVDSVDVRVGQRVRAYRISKKMSQTALGEKVGVTFQQIQKYERGANRMGSSRLKKIACILGIPVASLFGEDEAGNDSTIDTLVTEILSQRYATRLLRAFDAIKDDKQRIALLQLAESMGRGVK